MAVDTAADIDGLTLPELLTAAELSGRRLKEHLQYDVLSKANAIANQPDSSVDSLVQACEFTDRLFDRWQSYNAAIQQRIESILQDT